MEKIIKRKTASVPFEWYSNSLCMSEQEQLEFYHAIFRYTFFGEQPQMTGIVQGAFLMVKSFIDNKQSKDDELSKRRSINGKKGADARYGTNIDDTKPLANDSKTSNCHDVLANDSKTSNCHSTMANVANDGYQYNNNTINNTNTKKSSKKKDAVALPPLPYDPETDYGKFRKFIEDNLPYVSQLYPIKQEQYERLINTYPINAIIKTLREMDNWSDLVKKNRYQYNTLQKWLQKDNNR